MADENPIEKGRIEKAEKSVSYQSLSIVNKYQLG
jgi:hypothetical protein